MTDYTPITAEVRNSFSLHCESFCERCRVSEYANCDFHEAEFDRWLAEIKAQVIADAIAYLKKTPAVTLTGKGGGYELLETFAQTYREGSNE